MHEDHNLSRRSFVRSGALALVGLVTGVPGLRPERASALHQLASPTDDEPSAEVKRVLQQRFGDRPIKKGHVQLDIPEVAPDSREVPVFVETDLPMTPDDYVKAFHIVVDHNPDIYLAGFTLSPAMGSASIDTRIKMRRSSYVRAIAETSRGELWSASTMVYTTLNGCV
jgi:sulfur-oxidizing protein SoxY